MALFGPFPTLREQLDGNPRFAAALQYVADALDPNSEAHRKIMALREGESEKVELADGNFAINQAYSARDRADGFFESHRRYIDVQVILGGAEYMEVDDISRLKVSQEYNEERDFLKYHDVQTASRLLMRAGDAAIFHPADGHMPSLRIDGGPVSVFKTVVKVPVT